MSMMTSQTKTFLFSKLSTILCAIALLVMSRQVYRDLLAMQQIPLDHTTIVSVVTFHFLKIQKSCFFLKKKKRIFKWATNKNRCFVLWFVSNKMYTNNTWNMKQQNLLISVWLCRCDEKHRHQFVEHALENLETIHLQKKDDWILKK